MRESHVPANEQTSSAPSHQAEAEASACAGAPQGTSARGVGTSAPEAASASHSPKGTSFRAVASVLASPSAPPATHRTARRGEDSGHETPGASLSKGETSHRGDDGHARVLHAAVAFGAAPMKAA